jgi:uncharacterized protein
MRVKVGPVQTAYRMLVRVQSLDEDARTAVLRASGRETRGVGTVDATVLAALVGANGSTSVSLTTDLAVTGRVSQFGGGVLSEVADRLLAQFTEQLERDLRTASAAERELSPPAAPPTATEPFRAGGVAARALVRRTAPLGVALALGALALWARRRALSAR